MCAFSSLESEIGNYNRLCTKLRRAEEAVIDINARRHHLDPEVDSRESFKRFSKRVRAMYTLYGLSRCRPIERRQGSIIGDEDSLIDRFISIIQRIESRRDEALERVIDAKPRSIQDAQLKIEFIMDYIASTPNVELEYFLFSILEAVRCIPSIRSDRCKICGQELVALQ